MKRNYKILLVIVALPVGYELSQKQLSDQKSINFTELLTFQPAWSL
jgi:hypothetical protein